MRLRKEEKFFGRAGFSRNGTHAKRYVLQKFAEEKKYDFTQKEPLLLQENRIRRSSDVPFGKGT